MHRAKSAFLGMGSNGERNDQDNAQRSDLYNW